MATVCSVAVTGYKPPAMDRPKPWVGSRDGDSKRPAHLVRERLHRRLRVVAAQVDDDVIDPELVEPPEVLPEPVDAGAVAEMEGSGSAVGSSANSTPTAMENGFAPASSRHSAT